MRAFIPLAAAALISSLYLYNYTEPGSLVHTTCFHNASSDWHLKEIQAGKPDNGIPYIYYAIGYFPNAPPGLSPDFFSVVGLDWDANMAVLAAKRAEGRNIVLITTGSDYPFLNGTQCEVSLTPTMFAVDVGVSNKLISVRPITTTTTAGPSSALFDPTAGLASTAIGQLNSLGMMSTSLYTTIVGDALMSNIAASTSNTTTTSSSSSSSPPPLPPPQQPPSPPQPTPSLRYSTTSCSSSAAVSSSSRARARATFPPSMPT
jgi:hypothetical protein